MLFRSQDKYQKVSLVKGMALIFNNGVAKNKVLGVMHARDGSITNENRWLQRLYINHKEAECAKGV